MTRRQNTSQPGSRAGSADTNGHSPEGDLEGSPTALSGTFHAHLCSVDPETPVNEALDADGLAEFNKYNTARRNVGLTPYAIDTPLCDIDSLPIAVAYCMGQEPMRDEITLWSAETMEGDPHEAMAEFDAAKAEYIAERAQKRADERVSKRELRDRKVSPRALFTLDAIETIDGIGPDVARRARAIVLKINRRAWSAINPHDYTERTDLITAVELRQLGVEPEVIKALPVATDDDEIDAAERLARARKHYAKFGAAEEIDVAGDVVSPEQMQHKEPPRRMLGHWLYYGQLSELIGEPGSGKTFVALGNGLALTSGTALKTLGVPALRRVKVLYVAAEAPESAYLRVLGWCVHHDVSPAALTGWFAVYPKPVQLSDPEHVRQVRRYVADKGIELVVYDTRHLVTLGLDENDSGDQGIAIRALKDLNQDGAATLVVHHTPKDGSLGGGGRGSGAWFAAAYTSMYLKKDDKLGHVLVCDKNKDGTSRCKHPLHYADVRVPESVMPNARADERSTRVLAHVDPFTDDPGGVRELSGKEINTLHAIARHAGAKGMGATELERYAKTDDTSEGYDIGSRALMYKSLAALSGEKGHALHKYVRKISENPARYRATDEGWNLLVERGMVQADYAESHRHTVEDVGTTPFEAACTHIREALGVLVDEGKILPNENTTMTAAKNLVRSHMQGNGQEFGEAAWGSEYGKWKDDGRPGAPKAATD